MEALARVPVELWPRAKEMTCYSTMEPCMMCMSALILHGVGTVVFGGRDRLGGGAFLLEQLPPYYEGRPPPLQCIGPIAEAACDPLYERADARFRELPCG
jgi:tRNA(adenine34) deaminase